MFRTLIAIILVLVTGAPALAANWYSAAVDPNYDYAVGIDVTNIRTEYSKRIAWTLWVYRVTQRHPRQEPYDYELQQLEFDCARQSVRLATAVRYTEGGNSVDTYGPSPTTPVVPGSVGWGLMEAVCQPPTPASDFPDIVGFFLSARMALKFFYDEKRGGDAS